MPEKKYKIKKPKNKEMWPQLAVERLVNPNVTSLKKMLRDSRR